MKILHRAALALAVALVLVVSCATAEEAAEQNHSPALAPERSHHLRGKAQGDGDGTSSTSITQTEQRELAITEQKWDDTSVKKILGLTTRGGPGGQPKLLGRPGPASAEAEAEAEAQAEPEADAQAEPQKTPPAPRSSAVVGQTNPSVNRAGIPAAAADFRFCDPTRYDCCTSAADCGITSNTGRCCDKVYGQCVETSVANSRGGGCMAIVAPGAGSGSAQQGEGTTSTTAAAASTTTSKPPVAVGQTNPAVVNRLPVPGGGGGFSYGRCAYTGYPWQTCCATSSDCAKAGAFAKNTLEPQTCCSVAFDTCVTQELGMSRGGCKPGASPGVQKQPPPPPVQQNPTVVQIPVATQPKPVVNREPGSSTSTTGINRRCTETGPPWMKCCESANDCKEGAYTKDTMAPQTCCSPVWGTCITKELGAMRGGCMGDDDAAIVPSVPVVQEQPPPPVQQETPTLVQTPAITQPNPVVNRASCTDSGLPWMKCCNSAIDCAFGAYTRDTMAPQTCCSNVYNTCVTKELGVVRGGCKA